jgi:hypothetical protein
MTNRIIDVTVVSDLAAEPVSLTEIKSYLHIDFTNDDTLLSTMNIAARRRLESYCSRSFGAKTITSLMDLACYEELPYGPVNTITSAKLDGVESTNYEIDGDRFTPLSRGKWEVTYTTNGTVPEDLKLAIMAEVAYRYENRGDDNVKTLSSQAKDLAMPYKNLSWV